MTKSWSGLVRVIAINLLVTSILAFTCVMVAQQPDLQELRVGDSSLHVSGLIDLSFGLALLMVWGISAFQVESEMRYAFPSVPEAGGAVKHALHLGVTGVAYFLVAPVASLVLSPENVRVCSGMFIVAGSYLLIALAFALYRCIRKIFLLSAQGSAAASPGFGYPGDGDTVDPLSELLTTGDPQVLASLLNAAVHSQDARRIGITVQMLGSTPRAEARSAHHCPHCGSRVIAESQAFCGECGQPTGR